MKIYQNFEGTKFIEVEVGENSYRYKAIKDTNTLTLNFSLFEHVDLPVGSWIEFEGEKYYLLTPTNFKKNSTRNFEYTAIFEGEQAKLTKYKFLNPVDRKLKFSLTAKPIEHLQMLVDNLNLRESGWQVGECVESVENVISYNHNSCMEALSQMADTFETEWEVSGKTINLRKVEYYKDNPLPLSYGRGNGFKPGVGRSNYDDAKQIEILYVQGGDRNIDMSKYGNKELLLPVNASIRYDGTHFEGENGFDANSARSYTVDADGFSIKRSQGDLSSKNEGSLDCSNIYPNWEHVVTKAVEVKDGVWDIYAENTANYPNNSPANLNYNDSRIAGETATIIFQSGMLAGKEFDIVQTEKALTGYDYNTKRFELVSQEIDGESMPNKTFAPRVGDKFRLFGISLPDPYICDNATKSGASWEMFRTAVRYLYENEEPKFSFTGELDGIWAKKNWLNIGGRLCLGGHILFTDDQFQQNGVVIRIVGMKTYVNNIHSPEIELSNKSIGSSFYSEMAKIDSTEVVIDNNYQQSMQFTKRRFRDSQETIKMLEDATFENFSESISPKTVQTMAMLVGDESLQFRFVDNKTNPQPITHNVTYNPEKKILTSPEGIIQHMTLGIDTISPSHNNSDYHFWSLPQFQTPALTDLNKGYYLYAKVSKTDQTGSFYISDTFIGMNEVTGYYHLLMGILNSEYDGERSYVSLYGFTEILPGRITTDKIVSSDGGTFFDLLNGVISGKITFQSGTSGLGNIKEWPEKQSAIDKAQQSANEAKQEAAENTSTLDKWASDGYISPTEKTGLKQQHNDIKSEYQDIVNQAAKYGVATANYTSAYNAANDSLTKYTASSPEEIPIEADYANIAAYYSARQVILNSIVEATKKAIDQAQQSATNANAIANSKNRVFKNQPVPPYDLDDLWATGSDLYVCTTAKAQGASFSQTDWSKATTYDNTRTIIDGGIVTSGTVQLAGNDSIIKAGITGEGVSDSDVRMWAGATKENKNSAPFRVLQDGTIYASKGVFAGFLKIPFVTFEEGAHRDPNTGIYTVTDYFNLETGGLTSSSYLYILQLPSDTKYIGTVLTIYDNPIKTKSSPALQIIGDILHPENLSSMGGFNVSQSITGGRGGIIQFIGVSGGGGCYWFVLSDQIPESTVM